MEKLRVTFVSGHACIRCQKEAMGLASKGYKVNHIAGNLPSLFEHYNTFTVTPSLDHYIEAVKLYDKVTDIYHVQNEPSYFVTLLKEHSEKPVVLDVHDTFLTRVTHEEFEKSQEGEKTVNRYYTEERNNFQLADGLVFVSDPVKDITCDTYGLDQPSAVLPHFMPKRLYQYNTKEWLGGLVYEGRVDLKKRVQEVQSMHGFRYCDYEDLAKDAHELGLDFHLYAMRDNPEFMEVYKDISFVHPPKEYNKLLRAISRHDWGLVGNIHHTPQWEVTFANKLFEYIAACVPIVAMNAKHCGEFILEHDIGIVVDSVAELAERWGEHREKRANLIKKRNQFTMENNIHVLENLYEGVLNASK